jgi:hypothetical protein
MGHFWQDNLQIFLFEVGFNGQRIWLGETLTRTSRSCQPAQPGIRISNVSKLNPWAHYKHYTRANTYHRPFVLRKNNSLRRLEAPARGFFKGVVVSPAPIMSIDYDDEASHSTGNEMVPDAQPKASHKSFR